jgi:hypothetical protein
LKTQLPVYLKAVDVQCGIFMAICESAKELAKVEDVRVVAAEISASTGLTISTVVVAAFAPPSASKA